jgi:hypothetical protein
VDVIETVNLLMSKEGELKHGQNLKAAHPTVNRCCTTSRCRWADHDASISEWNARVQVWIERQASPAKTVSAGL